MKNCHKQYAYYIIKIYTQNEEVMGWKSVDEKYNCAENLEQPMLVHQQIITEVHKIPFVNE